MSFTFTIEKREGKLTDETKAMGVVSGPEYESTSIQFNRKDFVKLFEEASYTNIITLEGIGDPVEVTIHHIDQAPATNKVRHVEFYALKRGAEMNADIPVKLVGEAAVEKAEGMINQIVHSVPVSCRPRDLIQEIEVDINGLKKAGDTVLVKDLKVSDKITIKLEDDAAIVIVSAVKDEPEEEPVELVDAADVPVAGSEEDSEGAPAEEKEGE